MGQNKNIFYTSGSGLDPTDDFHKFYGSGLDRYQFCWSRTGEGLKFHSPLTSAEWLSGRRECDWV